MGSVMIGLLLLLVVTLVVLRYGLSRDERDKRISPERLNRYRITPDMRTQRP
jgi:hypothetical protein